jgi:hypothetical protein
MCADSSTEAAGPWGQTPVVAGDTLSSGGVPERTNGAVLKIAARLIPGRGFESHPRRGIGRGSMGLSLRILTVAVAPGLCAGTASAGDPGPPPEWSSRLSQPQLRPGALVVYRYDATSDDPLLLRVSVSAVSRQLRLAGKAAWLLEFPGHYGVTRRAGIRIRDGDDLDDSSSSAPAVAGSTNSPPNRTRGFCESVRPNHPWRTP